MKVSMKAPRGGFRINERKVAELVGKAAQTALLHAGVKVQEATRRAMSNRNVPARKLQWKVGERDGRDLVALVQQDSKPDKTTSWKTASHPQGLLWSSVKFYWDSRSKSVVVGPEKTDKIRALHEFGGRVPVYFIRTGGGPKRSRKFTRPEFGTLSNSPSGSDSINLGMKRVKKRPYMSVGIKKSMGKIPAQFRDSLQSGRPIPKSK